MAEIDAAKVYAKLRALRSDVAVLKEHLVNPDTVMTA